MAGPQIDVKANTGGATQGIEQVGRSIDNAARAADRANKKQYRPLASGAIQELREAVRLMERMASLSGKVLPVGGAGGSGHGSGPLAPTTPPREIEPSTPSGGGGASRRGGRWSNYGQNTGWGRVAGAFAGGVGGATSTIAGEAMAGARAGGSGFSAMGLLRGGLLGAGLFGAYKLGSAVSEGYDNAKTKAIDIDTLKRAMGDLGKNFGLLSSAADASANKLGINSNEAAKLAIEYNKLSGGLKGPADIISEVRNSVGFGRSYGIEPNQSGQFFASMRFMGGGDEKSSRRLALLIGETISRTGMNARASELIAAIQQFASATNRVSLAAPNVDGYAGAFAGMMGLGIKGMTSDSAMSILSSANSAMMNMGAAGEAGQNFTMAALSRGGKLNPIQAAVLSEGGMFGTRGSAFGAGGAYGRYLASQGVDINSLGLGSGGQTNFEAVRSHLDSLGGGADLKLDAAKSYFGLSSYNQAAALMAMQPQRMGALGSLLGRNGINVGDVNETGIATLGDIAAAGSKDDLMRVYSGMKARKGKGSLTSDEISRLDTASTGGTEELRNALVKIAASKDQEETAGSKARQQMKDIETATTQVGEKLLKPMEVARDALLVIAGKGGEKTIRRMAADLNKSEIDSEYKDRISQFMSGEGRNMPMQESAVRVRDMLRERNAKKAGVDDQLKKEDAAARAVSDPSSREKLEKIAEMEKKYGLPTGILKGVWGTESGFGKNLYNPTSGATGHFQFLPSTAKERGVQLGNFDSEAEGAAAYLADLKKKRGTWKSALFGYNGVVNNVGKGEKYVADVQSYGGMSLDDTPLPAGGPAPATERPIVIDVSGEHRLIDAQTGQPRSAPVNIQKRLTIPRSQGRGAYAD